MTTQQQKSERLEARVTVSQKSLFQHAADLEGRSLTDFMIDTLQEAAKRVIQEHEVLKLSLRDQNAFVEALFNPPVINEALLKAVKRHDKEVKE